MLASFAGTTVAAPRAGRTGATLDNEEHYLIPTLYDILPGYMLPAAWASAALTAVATVAAALSAFALT